MKFSILFYFFLLNACSYSLGYKKTIFLSKYKTLDIKNFKNKSQYVGLESVFSNSLISKFNLEDRSVFKRKSPVKLQSIINLVKISPLTRGNIGQSTLITEYQILIKIKVLLIDKKSKKILWSKLFERETKYIPPQISIAELSSISNFYNKSALKINFANLAEHLSNDIYSSLFNRF